MRKQLWKFGVAYVFLMTGMKTIRCMSHHTFWVVAIAAVVLFLYGILLTIANVEGLLDDSRSRRTRRFIFKKWYRCAFLWIAILYIAHGVIPVEAGNTVTITQAEMEQLVEENKQNKEQLDENLARMLAPEYYSRASEEEKVKVLLQVAMNEIEYLGIEAPSIDFQTIEPNMGAYYRCETNAITVNAMYLDDEKDVIRSLLHEMYHAYQNACINSYDANTDLLWNRQVQVWREEYENLHNDLNSNEGLITYYLQETEISAREYAEERAEIYYKYISE